MIKRCLREQIWVIFHVLLSVFIGLNELELEAAKEYGVSEQEVLLGVVCAGIDRIVVLLPLHELAAESARVLVAHLVHLDGVVAAVERHDEATRLVIRVSRDQLRLETQHVHVLLEHLLHVDLRGLGLQRVH